MVIRCLSHVHTSPSPGIQLRTQRDYDNNEFFTIPEVEQINSSDPRTRNAASFATISSSGTTTRGARYPSPVVHTWL